MVESGEEDPRALRDALGHYPTGVAVVTAPDVEEGRYVGVTVNSFSSVSLDPPLMTDFDTDPEREPLVFYRGGYSNVRLEDTSGDER